MELLTKENNMLRLNSPMSFGELSKTVNDNQDKEILQQMTEIIFEFYQNNVSEEKFDPQDFRSAKQCLKSVFNSI